MKAKCDCRTKFTYIYVCLAMQFAVSCYLTASVSRMDNACCTVQRPLQRTRRNSAVTDNSVTNVADIHEFYPKARTDLEEKLNNSAGKHGNGTEEFWLTAQHRVPVAVMQNFCTATKLYCGPGIPGNPGVNGLKGERGDRGFSGPRGPIGPPGDTGPRGPRGDRGAPGVAGLDGRDGVPGEPGLDGRPGRNGLDGVPGQNGVSGKPGENGTNGRPGLDGQKGSPGPRGLPGTPGAKGRQGKQGFNGTNGVPGICVYQVRLNDGTASSKLLIPPSILRTDTFLYESMVVKEDDHIRLKCNAAGHPAPTVSWFKINDTILLSKFKVESVIGSSLNITHVNRLHMGTYMCVADNGIPPSANKTFILDVQFSPLIRIYKQSIIVTNGSTAYLECEVEASPNSFKNMYWKKVGASERNLELNDKYRIGVVETSLKYKTRMQLNITKINSSDIGEYQCIARNELGKIVGLISVQHKGSEAANQSVWPEVAIFGKGPPTKMSENELCPPAECYKCPDIKTIKCDQEGMSSPFDLIGHREFGEVAKPLLANISNKDLKRTLACQVYAIGKPVYHRYSNDTYGCWMRDTYTSGEGLDDKYWVTRENVLTQLYEFNNKSSYRLNIPSSTYNLEIPFTGNAQVIFNNSFYYNQKDKPNIIRYDMLLNKHDKIQAPFAELTNNNLLYTAMHNYMDFSIDDNGFWVIYGVAENNTAVLKLDPYTLQIQMAWNISLRQQKAGEMFIVCGVLYVVDSVTDRTTNIRYAFDLYEGKLLEDVNVQFTNPFRKTTMIGYNHKNKELFTWDRGNQLTYPIRYHEHGHANNLSKDDKETDTHGFPITEE